MEENSKVKMAMVVGLFRGQPLEMLTSKYGISVANHDTHVHQFSNAKIDSITTVTFLFLFCI